jgi:hypothetical protein
MYFQDQYGFAGQGLENGETFFVSLLGGSPIDADSYQYPDCFQYAYAYQRCCHHRGPIQLRWPGFQHRAALCAVQRLDYAAYSTAFMLATIYFKGG